MSIAALRLAEINRFFAKRYGAMLPEDDAGREDAFIAAQHINLLGKDTAARVTSWCRTWAPWMHEIEVGALTDAVIARPRRWRADTLGQKLNLTEAERRELKIRTIGAVDVPKAERDKRDRERRRVAKEQKRRAAGVKARDGHNASADQPWKREGTSRATWYRRRQNQNAIEERRETARDLHVGLENIHGPHRLTGTEG